MNDDTNNGAGAGQSTVPSIPVPPVTPDTIGARLAQENKPEVPVPQTHVPVDAAPTVAEPAPAFDLSKLSPEALIALKAALDNAPLRVVKRGNPIVKLRRLNGRIVLDFGNCINTLQKDEVTNITSEVVLIPVKYMDANGKPEAKFVNVNYRDFMNADQIKCEVVGTRREEGGFSEGEVESNERPGIMVELRVKTIQDFFTVKLPEGSPVPQVEIEGKIANA